MTPSDFTSYLQRFWARVDRTGDCWVWTGETNNHGYGRIAFWNGSERARVFAHRLSLLLHGVELTADDVVMHECDNPPCVNPDHLRVGTQLENVRDAKEKGRMDLSGLDLGHAREWPSHPCEGCGAVLINGRAQWCPECKRVADRASHTKYNRAKRAAAKAGGAS